MRNNGITSTGGDHPFARYIKILGKGKAGARSLELHEARQAFGMILRGEAEPLQIGAFLMLLRVKEETPAELAGFVQACRESMSVTNQQPPSDFDWPSYAGKRHQHPWFILSMLLLSTAGYRIFVHGSSGHTAGRLYTEEAFRQLGLPVASTWLEVGQQLDSEGLSYLPLKQFSPALHELMQLRPLLGLRSPVNTLARLLNPLHAPVSLQSVFHPAYAQLHQAADILLAQPRALVFKGESGEVELKPQADSRVYLLENGYSNEIKVPRTLTQRFDSVAQPCVQPLRDLWNGTSREEYGLAATLATVAIALIALSPKFDMESARRHALLLWQNRDTSRLR